MINIADNCNNCGTTTDNCNCGPTCVGGLTCRCGNCGASTPVSQPTNTCPHCGSTNCTCCADEQGIDRYEPFPTRRVPRLLAPTRAAHSDWMARNDNLIIPDGVLCLTLDRLFNGSMEYFIGDGIHKYEDLPKYAGAEASETSKAHVLVLSNSNGKIDRSFLYPATATEYGVVKASVAGGAGQAILGDANGKYNFGNNATLNPACLNNGVIPSGVTIPASQVTGLPDSVGYATNAGHANQADTATNATNAANATHAAAADTATTATSAASADTATTAGKLSSAKRINVQMTVDGNTVGGYADFDGSQAITINMSPAISTGGSGGGGTSGNFMPLFTSSSGVGQVIRFGNVDGNGATSGVSSVLTLPSSGTWFVFGTVWREFGGGEDPNEESFMDFAFAAGGTNLALIAFNTAGTGIGNNNSKFVGLAVRIA